MTIIKPVFAGQSFTDVLGVSLPYQLTLAQTNEQLSLNGHSIATLWGTQAYVAALYTTHNEKRSEMLLVNDDPLAMVYYFVRDDISAKMLSKALIESILVNNGGWDDKKLDKTRMMELKDAIDRTFNAGDTLGFYYSPNNGVLMMINGEVYRHWPHAKSFFNMLLRTWVGPYPPSRGFKRAILNFPTN
ncbi:MAG: chalcone isomerase family protein [Candidatus Berkiella sp.]